MELSRVNETPVLLPYVLLQRRRFGEAVMYFIHINAGDLALSGRNILSISRVRAGPRARPPSGARRMALPRMAIRHKLLVIVGLFLLPIVLLVGLFLQQSLK